jgi:hypothetical protein
VRQLYRRPPAQLRGALRERISLLARARPLGSAGEAAGPGIYDSSGIALAAHIGDRHQARQRADAHLKSADNLLAEIWMERKIMG